MGVERRRRNCRLRRETYVVTGMISLFDIGDIFAGGHGETEDLRVQWGLEERGLTYRFHALDQTAGVGVIPDAWQRASAR
jgi:glutathione S-transferase